MGDDEEAGVKIVVLVGSRGVQGQTARAAAALVEGARGAGAQGEMRLLPCLRVERCRQCDDDGWGLCRREGRCVITDDFAGLVDEVRGADAVAFATPVYFGDLSESLRAFLDRLRRVTRHDAAKTGIAGKRVVGVCVAGGGGGGAPSCSVSMERVLATIGFDVVDMVPARRQNLPHKLGVLRATGTWLVAPSA
jgi:multimeric flavodoxin WrbA